MPGVQLDFELFLNPNSVYLMGTPNKGTLNTKKFPAIHNEDIKVTLLMRKVTLNASVYVRLQKERQLGKQIARYPVVRSEIRTFSFDGRTTQWEQDNVFVGRFPDRVMVGLLHSDAFNGNLQRYPFAFEKFGVTQIRQTLNGEEYPYRTLQLTGDQAYEDLLGYDRFLQAMGAYNEDKIPMLLPGDWGQGKNCTLFMFNNVPSDKADDPQYRNPRQSGNVRLVIDFAAAVNHNITVLVWSEYENVYEINRLIQPQMSEEDGHGVCGAQRYRVAGLGPGRSLITARVSRRVPSRPTTPITHQNRPRGVHCQHRSSGGTRTTLVRAVDRTRYTCKVYPCTCTKTRSCTSGGVNGST